MGKQLLLVGGGHAHMMTIVNLRRFIDKGHRVNVIAPSEYHYYSGMGPGMLGKTYELDDIRFATRHLVEKQGGTFTLGKAIGVNPRMKTVLLESGETVTYDVVSFNCGSFVPQPKIIGGDTNIFTVKPIEKLWDAQKRILEVINNQKQTTIGIIGGGPSAIEIAGNIAALTRHAKNRTEVYIFTRSQLMGRFPEAIRKKVIRSLASRGVVIQEESPITQIEKGRVMLASGSTRSMDLIFLALGVKPSPIFLDSGLPTGPDGGLIVNQFLQCIQQPDIFGGGDCIHFEPQALNKVGVYAVRQNPVLFKNLMASLENKRLTPFDPGGDYLLIFNLGQGRGLLLKNRLLLGGRLAFLIKDYIDRKFIQKFRCIE